MCGEFPRWRLSLARPGAAIQPVAFSARAVPAFPLTIHRQKLIIRTSGYTDVMPDLAESTALFQLFSDPTRVRLTALLERQELTVAEMVEITELSQSRVSSHLARLRDAGVLRDRRSGASSFYGLNEQSMPEEARDLWQLLRAQLDDGMVARDARRSEEVLKAREGERWPDSVAGQMERHYSPGRTWESLGRSALALLRLGRVLDVGSGDGMVLSLLAPHAERVVALDRSERLVAAARERLADVRHAEVVHGDMHELPFDEASFDQVLLLHVLQYTRQPERVIHQAARVVVPGGRIVISTLETHGHLDLTGRYGHQNSGFEPERLATMMKGAGLRVGVCEVTSRERRRPHFRVITAHAEKEPRS